MKLGIIGGGVMGEVLARSVIQTQIFHADQVCILDHNPHKLKSIQDQTGVHITSKLQDLNAAEMLILAIKPDNVKEILQGLNTQCLLISIVAGISLQMMGELMPPQTPMVRVMTNTPCLVGEGMSVLAPNSHVSEAQLKMAQEVFAAVGKTLILPEKYLDAVTGLSGSGPGFVFLIVDALIEAGVLQGLPRGIARQLVLQTLIGSAKLLEESDRHPAQLRDMVTSPGGTTIAGIQVMEEYKLRATLLKTVETATRRSRELGQKG